MLVSVNIFGRVKNWFNDFWLIDLMTLFDFKARTASWSWLWLTLRSLSYVTSSAAIAGGVYFHFRSRGQILAKSSSSMPFLPENLSKYCISTTKRIFRKKFIAFRYTDNWSSKTFFFSHSERDVSADFPKTFIFANIFNWPSEVNHI